jgi:hypothetical protein
MRRQEREAAERAAASPDPETAERQRDAQRQLDHYLKTLSIEDQNAHAPLLESIRNLSKKASQPTESDEERKRRERREHETELLRRGVCTLLVDTATSARCRARRSGPRGNN